jgi:hypothetical protein
LLCGPDPGHQSVAGPQVLGLSPMRQPPCALPRPAKPRPVGGRKENRGPRMANTRSAQNHMAHAKLLVGLYHACTWLARGFGAQSRITHPASLPALRNSSPAFILHPSSFFLPLRGRGPASRGSLRHSQTTEFGQFPRQPVH